MEISEYDYSRQVIASLLRSSENWEKAFPTERVAKRFVPNWLFEIAVRHQWTAFYDVRLVNNLTKIGSTVCIKTPQRFVMRDAL